MRKWSKVTKATAITLGAGIGFLIPGAILAGYGEKAGWFADGVAILTVFGIYAVGMMAGALWIGAEWMRSIDEAAREAHKSAWYWGGSGGMCVGGIAFILASAGPWRDVIAKIIGTGGQPVDYMLTGAALMLAPMMIGYVAVWSWWWLARMRG